MSMQTSSTCSPAGERGSAAPLPRAPLAAPSKSLPAPCCFMSCSSCSRPGLVGGAAELAGGAGFSRHLVAIAGLPEEADAASTDIFCGDAGDRARVATEFSGPSSWRRPSGEPQGRICRRLPTCISKTSSRSFRPGERKLERYNDERSWCLSLESADPASNSRTPNGDYLDGPLRPPWRSLAGVLHLWPEDLIHGPLGQVRPPWRRLASVFQ